MIILCLHGTPQSGAAGVNPVYPCCINLGLLVFFWSYVGCPEVTFSEHFNQYWALSIAFVSLPLKCWLKVSWKSWKNILQPILKGFHPRLAGLSHPDTIMAIYTVTLVYLYCQYQIRYKLILMILIWLCVCVSGSSIAPNCDTVLILFIS